MSDRLYPHASVQVEPTIADQVGSRGRSLRLKQLAGIHKQALEGAARILWAAGKEATVSRVLKQLAQLAQNRGSSIGKSNG